MALSGNQITGVGATGFPWRAYGAFSPKVERGVSGRQLTWTGVTGFPWRAYLPFTPKEEQIIAPIPASADVYGGGYFFRAPVRRKGTREILEERIRLGIIPAAAPEVIDAIVIASESIADRQTQKPVSSRDISAELRLELRNIGLTDILKKDIKRIYQDAIRIEQERIRIAEEDEAALMMFMSIM